MGYCDIYYLCDCHAINRFPGLDQMMQSVLRNTARAVCALSELPWGTNYEKSPAFMDVST